MEAQIVGQTVNCNQAGINTSYERRDEVIGIGTVCAWTATGWAVIQLRSGHFGICMASNMIIVKE